MNPGKSHLLNLSFGPRKHNLRSPLEIEGQAVGEVESLRYLGVELDSRFSFNEHWAGIAGSAKRAIGALARLVHREPRAQRHLLQEGVVGLLLHSLPYTPPTTEAAWRRLNGVCSFTAHLITNDWSVHGAEILRRASIPSASYLAFHHRLPFLQASIKGSRRYGDYLEMAKEPEGRALRKRLKGHEIAVPPNRMATRDRLGPIRLVHIWNGLKLNLEAVEMEPERALRSQKALTALLPTLYQLLDPELMKTLSPPT